MQHDVVQTQCIDSTSEIVAQSPEPASVRRGDNTLQAGESCESPAQNGAVLPSQRDAALAPSATSKYPDTQLYQFADIELAHGH